MKKCIALLSLTALAGSLIAADSPKDEVTAAAKKLGENNYSWKTTVAVPEGTQFRPGPTEGKTEKDGYTHIKSSVRDNTVEAVIKGDRTAYLNDGEWQLADGQGGGGGGGGGRRGLGGLRNTRPPAVQATEIAAGVKELKKDGDAISGDLTEDAAKTLMRFRRGGGGGGGGGNNEPPPIKDAKGSAKFWVKDGVLSKYEYKVSGKMEFNGNEVDLDRTTTVEIKDVGSTKVEVPEGAKKKLS